MEGSFPCVLSSGKWQRTHSPTARHIDEKGSYKTLYLLWDHLPSSSFWDWLLDSMAKFMPLTGPEPYQELLACLPCSSFPLPAQVHPHTLFTHALYPFKHNLKPWPWPPGKTEDARHLLLIKWKDGILKFAIQCLTYTIIPLPYGMNHQMIIYQVPTLC